MADFTLKLPTEPYTAIRVLWNNGGGTTYWLDPKTGDWFAAGLSRPAESFNDDIMGFEILSTPDAVQTFVLTAAVEKARQDTAREVWELLAPGMPSALRNGWYEEVASRYEFDLLHTSTAPETKPVNDPSNP